MHTVKENLKKFRKLEIKIRKLVNSTFSGEYRSAFRGQGLEFDEVRAYQFGDDIRAIDWNVTARSENVYIKLFREEREQELFVLFDISASLDFGPEGESKKDTGTEITSIFAWSAMKNNDRFGLLLSTDRIEKYFRPRKGRQQILSLIQTLMEFVPVSPGTHLKQALEYFRSIRKRRCVLIIISDFMDEGYKESIEKLSLRHEIIMIRLYHPSEIIQNLKGIIPVQDQERGNLRWIFSGKKTFSRKIQNYLDSIDQELQTLARRKNTYYVPIDVSQDYIPVLEKFFKKIHASQSR